MTDESVWEGIIPINVKKRLAGVVLLNLAYAGVAVGVWAIANGRVGISADLVTKQETVNFGAPTDWANGTQTNLAFENGLLHVSGKPTSRPTPAASTPTQTTPAPAVIPQFTVTSADQVVPKSSGTCTSVAPTRWQIASLAPPGAAFCVVYNPGANEVAGRFINTVNPGVALSDATVVHDQTVEGIYNPTNTSESIRNFVHFLLSVPDSGYTTDTSAVNWSNDYNQAIGNYTLRSFTTTSYQGVVFYLTNQVPVGDGASYIEFYNLAFTPKTKWQSDGLKVARIAADTQVSAVFTPQKQDFSSSDLPKDSSSTDSQGNNVSETGYNAQLGTEYVHDPSTGENYDVSPATDYSSDGPNGPGYYKQNGNDYIKLEPGRVD